MCPILVSAGALACLLLLTPLGRVLSRARLAGHGPVATPMAMHLPACGAQPPPLWSKWAPCRGRGGGGLLMARSACAAFGGCCSTRTSWFPCVLLCVLLGLVTLPCVGRPCARLLCCVRSSQFRALSFSVRTLTAGRAAPGASMSLPASHCGCRVVPLAVGWYQGHRALLHTSPNLQTDLLLVFVGVVLGYRCF